MIRIGLSALSFSYRCGIIGRGTSRMISRPTDVEALMSLASRAGLQTIEFPFSLLPDLDPARLARIKARLAVFGLIPILDSDVANRTTLEQHIPAAAALGARVLRVLVSDVIEGARSMLTGGWEAQLQHVITTLQQIRPLAEAHHVILAIENHQDATSEDLLRICHEVGGDYIGVTLDPINAITVAEEPLNITRALGPYIRNIHLTDYLVYPSEQGYRIVRCALGEGGMNFRSFFELVNSIAPQATCQIELTAHNARHIRLLTEEWWEEYGPRDIRRVLPALRLMAQNLRTADEDWRTPWERGADELAITHYEDQQFAASVAYLRTIGVLGKV